MSGMSSLSVGRQHLSSMLEDISSELGKHNYTADTQNSNTAAEPAEKRVKLDPTRLAYEKELRRGAAALADARHEIDRLQFRLQTVEQREKQSMLSTQMEVEELAKQAKHANAQLSWLQSDLDKERSQNAELSKVATEARSQMRAAQLSAEARELATKQEVETQIQALTEELSVARQQLSRARSDQLSADTARQLAESQLAAEQQAAAEQAHSDGGRRLTELQLQLSTEQSRVKELEDQLETVAEDARLGTLMQERLADYPRLQEENKVMAEELNSLRHMVDRTLMLEEKVDVLQKKANRFDELQLQLETLREQCASCEHQLLDWQEAAGGDVTDPNQLAQMVTSLRRQHLLAEEAAGNGRAELSAAEARCTYLQAELDKLHTAEKQHKQMELEGQLQLRKMQRKLTLVTMERDSCKRVLDAYEAETTASLTSIELQRAEDREEQLAACREQLDLLERQLQAAASSGKLVLSAEEPAAVQQLQDRLHQLQQQHQQLTTEKEGLEAQLEERALRGDYNPATTKVLTFKENPAAAASSKRTGQLERLQTENAELRSRVQLLSANSASAGLSEEAAKQISALRSQLRASELRQRRLKEVFGRSTQELRHTVSQLTGYKVNVDGQQVRLRSVYATRPEHALMFHRDGADTIQMLETSFSAQLSDLVDEYLFREDSLPGFLSALTLRLLREGPPAPATVPATAAAGDDDDDCEIVELD